MKNFNVRYFFFFVVISFILNIIWENLQAPFYAGFVSFFSHFSICLKGALGDVLINLSALLFMILIKQALPLKFKFNKSDFFILAALGFIIAAAIEKNALFTGKWNYDSAMPLIPYLNIGLLPILQMMFLLPLSFYLARRLTIRG
ncbi:MAG: hypothetical protein HYW71_02785 [Candidatus Niyogibacteria bacterium]|nr:hypothetical protein [Candidatus Niyogibacteria bacterium]